MQMRRWRWLFIALIVLVGAVLIWREFVVHWIEPLPSQVDEGEKSSNLASDLRLMWETQKLGGTPDPTHRPNRRASTVRAINAASRVFNTVDLVGKTREEVVGQLGDPKTSSDSIYNFPFWPAPKGSLVYRFDCGSFGWQFNVVLGADERVEVIERYWIH